MSRVAQRSHTRNRLLVALAVVLVLLGCYGIWWLTSARAISFTGTGSVGPVGLSAVKPLDPSDFDTATDVPPAYGWHQGGAVYQALIFHNSLHFPITITGIKPDQVYPQSFMAGPELRRPKPGVGFAADPRQSEPAHDVRVNAGGNVELDLLWPAIGRCSRIADRDPVGGGDSWTSAQTVTFRYQLLPFLTQTVTVPLGSPGVTTSGGEPAEAFDLKAPHLSQCPAGYPKPLNSGAR